MDKTIKNFMDTLNAETIKRANEKIKEELFEDWSAALDNNDLFYGDKEYAERSGEKEILDAFNKFYGLTPDDKSYLSDFYL